MISIKLSARRDVPRARRVNHNRLFACRVSIAGPTSVAHVLDTLPQLSTVIRYTKFNVTNSTRYAPVILTHGRFSIGCFNILRIGRLTLPLLHHATTHGHGQKQIVIINSVKKQLNLPFRSRCSSAGTTLRVCIRTLQLRNHHRNVVTAVVRPNSLSAKFANSHVLTRPTGSPCCSRYRHSIKRVTRSRRANSNPRDITQIVITALNGHGPPIHVTINDDCGTLVRLGHFLPSHLMRFIVHHVCVGP